MNTQAPLHRVTTTQGTIVTNPPLARLLFDDTRFAVVWLVIRVLVGWEWVQAGWHKVFDATGANLFNQAWMNGGTSLVNDQGTGFWQHIVGPTSTANYGWFKGFIQFLIDAGTAPWFAKLVALGELAVGIALILGLFVGIAAFFGSLMNWNYVMAGVASSNGLLFLVGGLLMLAWKIAGYYGLDRYVLPRLGMPWKGKPIVKESNTAPAPTSAPANVGAAAH